MSMQENINQQELLDKAKKWFKETIAKNHSSNTQKLTDPCEFKINPFLVSYLANFLTGKIDPISIAKALIYPRVLGTSITTSFGTNTQKFTSEVLGSIGSTTPGIDIEFIDQVDGHKKYCQLKAGPITINRDDIKTIDNHFVGIKNLSRTNNLKISTEDMIIGILYGEEQELGAHYKDLKNKYHYNVYIGKGFWHRLTGDEDFYYKLIRALAEIASEFDGSHLLEETIEKLANSDVIQNLSKHSK